MKKIASIVTLSILVILLSVFGVTQAAPPFGYGGVDQSNVEITGGTITGTTVSGATVSNSIISDGATMTQISTPAAPAAGKNIIYPKSDNKLYILHADGTEVEVWASAQAGEG